MPSHGRCVLEERAQPPDCTQQTRAEQSPEHSWFSAAPGGQSGCEDFTVELDPIYERGYLSLSIGPQLGGLILILQLDPAKKLALELAQVLSEHAHYFRPQCSAASESLSISCGGPDPTGETQHRRSQIGSIDVTVAYRRAAIHLRGLATNGDSFDAFMSAEKASALLYDLKKLIMSLGQASGH